MAHTYTISAVIVTYYPDLEKIRKLIEQLSNFTVHIFLIDNTPAKTSIDKQIKKLIKNNDIPVTFVKNLENKGIGYAQNQGLKISKELKIDYCLLLDQDSSFLPGIERDINRCISRYHDTQDIAAFALCFRDIRYEYDGTFIKFSILFPKKLRCKNVENCCDIDYAISSGTLINLHNLQSIGYMDDSLFIDYVDIEWCLRARSKNYRIIGIKTLNFLHELGDKRVPVLFGLTSIPFREPRRTYFLFRNAILLYKKKYISLRWKLYDLFRLLLRCIIYAVHPALFSSHYKFILTGIRDGLMGRTNINENFLSK